MKPVIGRCGVRRDDLSPVSPFLMAVGLVRIDIEKRQISKNKSKYLTFD
ncbi:hypothetical protein [Burkholderia cenocepacia]|nr:hypothetical protein [Burkholderia cenocepacia]MDR8031425.1 hypothetical protein [Burkholderia cenocepacia]MDR8040436.1 hypothetical protein [Burkholderia cenocepacia]MDR8076225.1 hypothetical protein [Burkholderia cenocepacia]MEC4774241.1 hypothetical protein [Burkholderia cenocepacia]